MSLKERAKRTARRLRRDAHMLWIAARDPRTPRMAKLVASFVAAYVLSPIDLIPDFIPMFGLLDELILVPIGVGIALRLTPAPLIAEYRAQADSAVQRPVSRLGGLLILGLWLSLLIFVAAQIWAIRYW